MAKVKTDIPDELRAPLLQAALVHVPFEGWSDKILTLTSQDMELAPEMARLAFPGGVGEMIDLMASEQDQKMVASCEDKTIKPLKIHEKITLLVRSRLEAEQDIREVAHRTVTYLALPMNAALAAKILYRTVDLMWKTIHDPSTDFNFYTKRLTLSVVYSSCFLYWLGDDSDDYADTWAFLDRRIENVMQFEKTKARTLKMTADLPNLWELAGKFKYGKQP